MIIVSLFIATICEAKPWSPQEPQGWLWYKNVPQPLKPLPKNKTPVSAGTKASPVEQYPYTEKLKNFKKEFAEIQARAVMNPTLENVQSLFQAQNKEFNGAEVFEKMWMLASLLDATAYRSSDQPFPAQREIYKQQNKNKLESEIKSLSQSYGLFFVFKNDCPYCHQFAPIVRKLIDTYSFEFKAISKDGLPLKEFPEAVPDNGTIGQLNPEGIYPALFLVNPKTREVIPLARGLVNMPQLKENMNVIIQFLKEK